MNHRKRLVWTAAAEQEGHNYSMVGIGSYQIDTVQAELDREIEEHEAVHMFSLR